MESTSRSSPRQHWFAEGYQSFLHFPQSILGKIFNSKKFLKVTNTLFEGRSFRPLLHTFLCFLLAYFCLFGHFACVHIMHVPPSATGEVVEFEKYFFQHPQPILRSLNSNLHEFVFVTPPKLFWVGKLSPNKFNEGAYTLFRICFTRICMISNLFQTPLYIF